MHAEQVVIEIEGAEVSDLYPDLSWVSVETGDDLAGLFRLELRMLQGADGSWSHVDDERLTLWRRVVISAGFEDGPEPLIAGHISHVLPVFDPDPARCRLQVWGMDATVLLDREEKLRAWPSMTDSDIASAVIAEYGLLARVEATDVQHDEAVSTVIQRESDAALLRRLAARNGYVFRIESDPAGDTVVFGPPGANADPLPPLAVHFGDETSVISLSVRLQGPGPAAVAIAQLDRTEKQVVAVQAAVSEREPMGSSTADALLPPGFPPALAVIGQSPATGQPEMQALCQAVYERGQWLVTADALVDGNRYGSVLRPLHTVLVKGAGDTHSGEYEIAAVTHRIGIDGYQQQARLRRNAVGLTGSEDFGGGGPF